MYAGKSSEVNIHKAGEFEEVGKSNVNVEVVLPDERCLNFKFDRDISLKDNVSHYYYHYHTYKQIASIKVSFIYLVFIYY